MYVYDEEVFDEWYSYHHLWMTKAMPKQMSDSFMNERKSLITDMDKHGFMFFHLLHMSTMTEEDGYDYWNEAKDAWNVALPMVQAFNTMMMGMASRAGDEQTHHAIGLANACMMKMFSTGIKNEGIKDEEE
tara:strand:- start:1114 stop:1506 length:393 start_codon:yes stop_codon:yes gene_type:complete